MEPKLAAELVDLLVIVSNGLAKIAAADVRPGHVDYMTKSAMAHLARQCVETVDRIHTQISWKD